MSPCSAEDLTSTTSIFEFANKARTLERLDGVVENIGTGEFDWVENEGFDQTIKVNVISSFLVLLLLLPKLRETAATHDAALRVAVLPTEMAQIAKFPERNKACLCAKLSDREHWEKTMWDK